MVNYFVHYFYDIIILAIIYFPLSIYALRRIFYYQNVKKYKKIANIISIVVFIFFPLCIWAQFYYNSLLTTYLYYISFMFIGIILYLVMFTIILEIIKWILEKNKIKLKNRKYWAYIIIFLTLLVIILSYINTLTYKEKYITLESPKIQKDVRLVQISDIHLFGKNQEPRFERIYKHITSTSPDIIVITGDFIDIPGKVTPETIQKINDYNIPVLFIYGNHENYYGEEQVRELLETTHIIILDNNNIDYNDYGISVIGIGDSEDKNNLQTKLSTINIDKNKYNILLNHRPVNPELVSSYGIDLMLSGHTHAGQFFPGTVSKLIGYFNYFRGLHEIGNMKLYINQGTGYWAIKIRNFSRNEITIFDLKKE